MQGSKVDQVITLLDDILGGLRTDQSTDDMEHTNVWHYKLYILLENDLMASNH